MMTTEIAIRLINVLAKHPGLFPINKEKFVELLMSVKFEPTSKFHIELPDDEKHHQTFQETTDRYYCLSIRRILVNNNVNKTKISLLKMAFNAIFNRGWSSSVFSRRLRLDKQMSSFLLENDYPFSLLAKLQTYDFCEGSGRFFRISWPLLVIFALDQSKKSVVYRWENENCVYEKEVGIFLKYFKKISLKNYIACS